MHPLLEEYLRAGCHVAKLDDLTFFFGVPRDWSNRSSTERSLDFNSKDCIGPRSCWRIGTADVQGTLYGSSPLEEMEPRDCVMFTDRV